jgi:hypothetical protein
MQRLLLLLLPTSLLLPLHCCAPCVLVLGAGAVVSCRQQLQLVMQDVHGVACHVFFVHRLPASGADWRTCLPE